MKTWSAQPSIEPQPSAHPYRDWNERITAECYRPNAAARVVNDSNHIIKIVDNYQRMSFNVGPTLMSWMEEHAPDVHAALIEADRASMARFDGHGSAMAQAYNHMIMPLASPRDRMTQVRWGISDFIKRYGRKPEGMWLPECAANIASLEALASEGISFTVLAPRQARAWRPQHGQWRNTSVDPGRVYKCYLPSGRTIVSRPTRIRRAAASMIRRATRSKAGTPTVAPRERSIDGLLIGRPRVRRAPRVGRAPLASPFRADGTAHPSATGAGRASG